MGRIRTIARRTFLIGSAAIAGGVAFGAYVVARPHENPLADDLPDGAATFNPWVRIDSKRITLITPHHDIGQGVVHMQSVLIAEENSNRASSRPNSALLLRPTTTGHLQSKAPMHCPG